MAQAQRVPGLVQRHGVQIDIGSDVPILVLVQVHVAGQRFGIRGRGKERMRQHRAARLKGIVIAVEALGEHDRDGLVAGCTGAQNKLHIGVFGPFLEGANDFRLRAGHWQLGAHLREHVLQLDHTGAGAAPAVSHQDILPNRSGRHLGSVARHHVVTLDQIVGSRKDVGHLVKGGDLGERGQRSVSQHMVWQ